MGQINCIYVEIVQLKPLRFYIQADCFRLICMLDVLIAWLHYTKPEESFFKSLALNTENTPCSAAPDAYMHTRFYPHGSYSSAAGCRYTGIGCRK